MNGDGLRDAFQEKRTGVPAHQFLMHSLHQRIQRNVREGRNIPQPGVRRIFAEHLCQGALKQGQRDEYRHGFKRIGGNRFPAAIIRSAT